MPESSNALTKLDAATRMLAEAKGLDDIKQVHDIAQAAAEYARAAKLGLEAQNHAAEIKLRAERKAGELLSGLERKQGSGGVNQHTSFRPTLDKSDYAETLTTTGTTRQDAHRWQMVASIPEPEFERVIAETKDSGKELTTHGLLAKPHVAHNAGENEWYTPVEYIKAAVSVMGDIDVDPASNEIANSVVGANAFFSLENDGLAQDWNGRVWMNPPYSSDLIKLFTLKLVHEVCEGRVTEACVLVNNATETNWFGVLAAHASAVCFPNGRVKFWHPDRSSSSPLQGQAVIYIGDRPAKFRHAFAEFGWTAAI